jgi:hypothetical protein
MSESIRNGVIIVGGFGLIVLTSALGAISMADRIQPLASMSDQVITATIVTATEPR